MGKRHNSPIVTNVRIPEGPLCIWCGPVTGYCVTMFIADNVDHLNCIAMQGN